MCLSFIQLNDTRTEETLQGIMSQDYVLDILQRTGVTTPLTVRCPSYVL